MTERLPLTFPEICNTAYHSGVREAWLGPHAQFLRLLGYRAATNHDPPPGNMVVWRGLPRLHDIALGISIGTRRRCGLYFCFFFSGAPVGAQKELKRWLAGKRIERRESLVWTDLDGRNLSTLPAASV